MLPHRSPRSCYLIDMPNGLAISVLDLVGMHTGESAGSAIARSVDLAQHVERLGYTRFWLAEHHSIEGLACSATAVKRTGVRVSFTVSKRKLRKRKFVCCISLTPARTNCSAFMKAGT